MIRAVVVAVVCGGKKKDGTTTVCAFIDEGNIH
jgi:hypothetical protein